MIRLLVSLALLGGLVWFLEMERRGGRFLQVDEVFEDFLIANVRERFVPGARGDDAGVVLVEMREADAKEYAAWPPEPIDWRMVLEVVRGWEPEVLVVPEVLNWGAPTPEFVGAVGDALEGFPSVVLGVEGVFEPEMPAGLPFLGGLESRFPSFGRVTLARGSARPPFLKGLVRAPEEAIRAGSELGLLVPVEEGATPYAARVSRDGEEVEWLPSVLAQTLSRVTRSPYTKQRLRLGAGAGAHLEGGVFVPLTEAGGVVKHDEEPPGLRVVNALDLMTGTLAETLDADTQEAVLKARVVVVGLLQSQGESARTLAGAVAEVLTLPKVRQASMTWQYGIWGLAGLAALGIIQRGRQGAMMKAAGLVFAGFVASYLVFDSQMLWCPPTIPAAVLLAGGVLGRVVGKKITKADPGSLVGAAELTGN